MGKDLSGDLGQSLADYCTEIVHENQRFILVDRAQIQATLAEEDFAAVFRCDDTKCLVNFGKKLRAQLIIHGRVHRIGKIYQLSLKMLDVGTGAVLAIKTTRAASIEELLNQVPPVTRCLIHDSLSDGR